MTDTISPKMTEALIAVRDYRTTAGIRPNTVDALLRRSLIRWQSEGVHVLTEAGAEIVGRKDTTELDAALAEESRTLREQYTGTPARFNPEVIDQVHAIALTAAQKLVRLQAAAPRHDCSLWRQGIDCMCADAAELDVLADEDDRDEDFNELVDSADPSAARREREATGLGYTPAQAKILGFPAADLLPAEFHVADEDVDAIHHLVLVRLLSGDDELFRVEGTTLGPVDTLVWLTPVGDYLMALRPAFPVPAHRLFRSDSVAACRHGLTLSDTCPGCDVTDEDGQTGRDVGRHAILTELGFSALVERRPADEGPGLRIMPVDARDTDYLERRPC